MESNPCGYYQIGLVWKSAAKPLKTPKHSDTQHHPSEAVYFFKQSHCPSPFLIGLFALGSTIYERAH